MSTLLVGGDNGTLYRLEQEAGITSMAFLTTGGEQSVMPL